MSGRDAGLLEGEEGAGAAAAHLDVVDDQQHVVALAQLGQRAQPLGAGDVDAALALHRLDDHGGGLVEAGALVVQQPLEPQEVRRPCRRSSCRTASGCRAPAGCRRRRA